MKETTYIRNNSIFGEVKDLNARRNNFRSLLAATFNDEELLWKSEVEYEEILSGVRNKNDNRYAPDPQICIVSQPGFSSQSWKVLETGWTEVTPCVWGAPKASVFGRRGRSVGGARNAAQARGRERVSARI